LRLQLNQALGAGYTNAGCGEKIFQVCFVTGDNLFWYVDHG
jgi:hypothetical protein